MKGDRGDSGQKGAKGHRGLVGLQGKILNNKIWKILINLILRYDW